MTAVEVRVARGTVKSWSNDVGWGVLESPEVPGEIFCHFMKIQGQDGFRTLTPGASVIFECRTPGQDGFEFAANWARYADPDADPA
jgi:CspA family cold shock protein